MCDLKLLKSEKFGKSEEEVYKGEPPTHRFCKGAAHVNLRVRKTFT